MGNGTTEIFVTGDCQEDEERAELEPACLVVHVECAGEHTHLQRWLLLSLLPY